MSYDGTYTDIAPGFVSIPGFINRVDIRETKQDIDYRFRPKRGWIVDWGPSLVTRHDFDHTGLRLDTDYSPYLSIQGRGQTSIYLRPYEELRERLRREPEISAASTYTDRATAERVVGTAIAEAGRKLAAWESRTGRRPNLVLDYKDSLGQPIGRSQMRGQRSAQPCDEAVIVLRWDERRNRYYVLTSYPEARR